MHMMELKRFFEGGALCPALVAENHNCNHALIVLVTFQV